MAGQIEDDVIIVLDDFLEDPLAIRQLALEADYPPLAETPYFPGRNSAKRYALPGLDDHVARIAGQRLAPTKQTAHGRFRVCLAGEKGRGGVHIDPSHWSGVYYLTLDEHAKGGTDFFIHKDTGAKRAPVYPEDWAKWNVDAPQKLWSDVIIPQTNDTSKWELWQHVPMKFNRLILFRPWLWHNAGPGFGTSVKDGRLIYVLFYDAIGPQ